MVANNIKVVVVEADFAALCRLGFPISLSLQLQQSGLTLADALWTARASGHGSGSQSACSGLQQLKPHQMGEKEEKLMKAEVRNVPKSTTVTTTATTTKVLANTANHGAQETPISAQRPSKSGEMETSKPAEVTASSAPAPSITALRTSVLPACQSTVSVSDSYPLDLKNYNEVSYEKKDQLHGISYTFDHTTGWTPVVGRKKKQQLPEGLLRRLPPDARQRYATPL